MTILTQRVVVTGAGGYIGPHVVTALLDRGHTVIANVRVGSVTRFDPRAEVVEADILDDAFTIEQWGEQPDVVVHLAWKDGFRHQSREHMSQVSAHYRFLTALADRGIGRIVALGTMHEVGYWEGPIDSDTPTRPLSAYGIAKDTLRRTVELALPDGISFAWARAYYIEGDDRRSQSVFSRLLDAVDRGETEFPFVTGKARHDFIHVDELGRQLAVLAERRDVTGIINCASGSPVSLADEVESFIATHDLPITLRYGVFRERPYDSPGVWADASAIQELMRVDATSSRSGQ